MSEDGTTILSISRETISSILHLTTNTFVMFSPTQALAEYQATPSKFQNTLARKWTRLTMGVGLGFQWSLPKTT